MPLNITVEVEDVTVGAVIVNVLVSGYVEFRVQVDIPNELVGPHPGLEFLVCVSVALKVGVWDWTGLP